MGVPVFAKCAGERSRGGNEFDLVHPGMNAGGGKNYLPAFPGTKDAISKYDVIFLGDVGIGQREINENDAELIKGLVEQQGSGLVFLPGRRGRELTFTNSPLKELVPIVFDGSKPNGQPSRKQRGVTLTGAGKGHLLTRFRTDENLNGQLWQNLPGFFSFCHGGWKKQAWVGGVGSPFLITEQPEGCRCW